MDSLKTANKLISDIALSNKNITPITLDDYDLFSRFFKQEEHSYGNSWTYVTQGVYGIGPNNLGYKYYDGTNLSVVTFYPRHGNADDHIFYWIRPMGPTVMDAIANFAKELLANKGYPTYVKKIFKSQFDTLINYGFKDTSEFPWFEMAPMEDDTYPEQVLCVEDTLAAATTADRLSQIKRSYRYYKQYKKLGNVTLDSLYHHRDNAFSVLDDFFTYQASRNKYNISKPQDYYNIVTNKIDCMECIENMILTDDGCAGFTFIEKQEQNFASQYATITLRKNFNHLSDFIIFHNLFELKEKGIKYLNLGGSESPELDKFKNKFKPAITQQMYWACLH
jgi:hypothetical protein